MKRFKALKEDTTVELMHTYTYIYIHIAKALVDTAMSIEDQSCKSLSGVLAKLQYTILCGISKTGHPIRMAQVP